ncbi:hypothetical protein GGI23_001236 [Coemansia sp. RSA 2559]|nr:hypothetical protein GGI23_001236 [Coemansia sp. RSA 2559]KAJ2860900.1 hypothetical protein GGI22_002591 [Coemansia erecta]
MRAQLLIPQCSRLFAKPLCLMHSAQPNGAISINGSPKTRHPIRNMQITRTVALVQAEKEPNAFALGLRDACGQSALMSSPEGLFCQTNCKTGSRVVSSVVQRQPHRLPVVPLDGAV